jgi:hypothetical protein
MRGANGSARGGVVPFGRRGSRPAPSQSDRSGMRTLPTALALLLACAAPVLAAAQVGVTTDILSGRVTDAEGAPLAGVRVEATSGGERHHPHGGDAAGRALHDRLSRRGRTLPGDGVAAGPRTRRARRVPRGRRGRARRQLPAPGAGDPARPHRGARVAGAAAGERRGGGAGAVRLRQRRWTGCRWRTTTPRCWRRCSPAS